jgi:hypothetical protein
MQLLNLGKVEQARLALRGFGAKTKRSAVFTSLSFCEKTEELACATRH